VVQNFFTTQLSVFFHFNHLRVKLIRTHVAQISMPLAFKSMDM